MAGPCPKDIKKLKGGVNCINAKKETCFCSKAGCECGTYGPIDLGQGARNFNSQFAWCEKYDPAGANNKWCKDHMPIQDSVAGNTAAGLTDATKSTLDAFNNTFSANNMTTVAIIGIGVLALFMVIS